MNYTTTFECEGYECKVDFDGNITFVSFWWENIPTKTSGPLQAAYDNACQTLCKEAFVPYDKSKFSNVLVPARGPIKSIVV